MARLSARATRRILLSLSPALVAVLVGVLAVDGARRTGAVADRVDRTHVAIETADRLLRRMVDAETGQRGYVVTGDERFLEPDRHVDADVAQAMRELDTMVVDPAQRARLAALRPLIAERFAMVADVIRLRRTEGERAAAAVIAGDRDRETMDSVRTLIADIAAGERARLLAGQRDERAHTQRTVVVVVVGALAAGLLALAVNLTMAAAVAAEERASRALASANERLMEQGAELEQQNEHLQEASAELIAQQGELAAQAAELAGRAEEVRQLNASLEAQVRDLAALNAGLESFSYSVSHDLRTPLGAISGMSTLLEEDYADRLDDEGRRMLSRIRANALHMGELIDGLLELARVSRGELKLERVDVTSIAREIGGGLARQAPGRAVRFEVDEGLTVCADRRLLSALVQNLLTNAWKFSAKVDAPAVEVRRHAEGPPDTFFVRDNGAGFDMAYAAKLFAAFQRLHAKEFEGTGIGLATVDRVVRRHGGAVWAEGEVGKGATFYVTLPEGGCE